MKCRIFVLCALLAGLAAATQAQAPGSFAINCNPNLVGYPFTATQSIQTHTCTTDAKINGVAFTVLTFSSYAQTTKTASSNWAVIVGTLANGDQVFFTFHADWTPTSSLSSVGTTTYKMVGGTGIATGISGSGTCKDTALQGKGNEMACSGT
jgi:hypothetical protein